jgi:hypothetical protein
MLRQNRKRSWLWVVPMMCRVPSGILRRGVVPAERRRARPYTGVGGFRRPVIVVALAVSACGSSQSRPTAIATPGCGNTACPATINTVKNSPVLTEFSGRACSGTHSAWFLNVVQGGGGTLLRPSYRLNWSFSGGASAKPTGTVTFISSGGAQATGTLVDGVLTINGKSATRQPVSGSGSLSVALTGTSSAPTLTLTESGLDSAEKSLGFQSPFVVNGGPAVIPVTVARTVAGCGGH